MYEYSPKNSKLREKITVAVSGISALALYAVSVLPGTAFAWAFQLGAVLCLTLAVLVTARFLLRRFVYAIEPSDRGNGTDFVILEFYGKRVTTVCRIALENISRVEPRTKESGSRLAAEKNGKRFYRYVAELFPRDAALVWAEESGEECILLISADAGLLKILSSNSNNRPVIDEK